MEPRFFPRAIC